MNRKASLLFIFATVAIDSIGIGIIIPVLPDVIRKFVSDPPSVSRLYGYFIATYALMQFLFSPVLGRLADRFGRRPVLLTSLLGGGVDYLFMAFAPALPLLFLGRIISGITGASFTVAGAYIADISTDENRSKNFGVMGAGFGLGFIAGPAIGGLIAEYGSHYPFIAAAAFNLLNFLFGLFVLPESLTLENRRAFSWSALNPFASLLNIARMPAIRVLVVVFVLMNLAGQTHPSIWTLYTEHRFGWTAAQVGASLAMVGLFSALSQGVLTGWLVKKFGDHRVLFWGVAGEAVSFALFGLVTAGWMIYAVIVVSSLAWASQPTLQSLISREVSPQAQGELQGALMSIGSLMAIFNPIVMTTLFSYTSDPASGHYLPGSPYLLASLFLLIAWLALVLHQRKSNGVQPTI